MLAVALSASVMGLAATPAAATHEPVLDANCPGPPNTSITVVSDRRWGQIFTAQTTGTLVRGETEIQKNVGTGDWVMEIYATDPMGAPTNTVLASTTIADATVPFGDSRIAGTFATGASVQAGQAYVLSLRRSANWTLRDRSDACPGNEVFGPDPRVPSTDPGSWTAASEYDMVFAVFVAPPDPEPGDTAAPNTTITKGPKNKTKKKKAKFEFTGTDARAIASFQCSLDGGAFAACTSPHTVKVKKGKHTFEVRAVDQAGNVGTPASDNWKVKRKKKR